MVLRPDHSYLGDFCPLKNSEPYGDCSECFTVPSSAPAPSLPHTHLLPSMKWFKLQRFSLHTETNTQESRHCVSCAPCCTVLCYMCHAVCVELYCRLSCLASQSTLLQLISGEIWAPRTAPRKRETPLPGNLHFGGGMCLPLEGNGSGAPTWQRLRGLGSTALCSTALS